MERGPKAGYSIDQVSCVWNPRPRLPIVQPHVRGRCDLQGPALVQQGPRGGGRLLVEEETHRYSRDWW